MNNLLKVRGFIPLIAVVYLNAFIDLGHKVIIQNTVFKIYDGSQQIILSAIVNALILIPFILFFYTAGKTSDTYAKTRILRTASIAALIITSAISFCYWQGMFWWAFALTFFMGVQSAYYGPAKYGLLKELVSNQQLASANGMAQALATVGILSGILTFSILFEMRFTDISNLNTESVIQTMTPLSLLLIIISAFECCIAWTIPVINTPNKEPESHLIKQEIHAIIHSPILFPAIIGLSVFWSVGQMLLATYPAFAKSEIGITNTVIIQGLLATIGIGIMTGSFLAGRFSKTHIEIALIPLAGIGIILMSLILPMVTSLFPAILMFFTIGIVGGILIVPLNAIVQYCTPKEKLGITIANSNLMQNIAMLSCLVITMTAALFEFSAKNLLFFIAMVATVGITFVIYRLPQTLVRLFKKPRKALVIEGFNNLPGNGQLLLLTKSKISEYQNLIQMAYPRKLMFTQPDKWNENTVCCLQHSELNQDKLPPDVTIIEVVLNEEENRINLFFTQYHLSQTSV